MQRLFLEFKYRLKRKTIFLLSYYYSYVFGFLNRRSYRNINTFCIFIGYPRSGHTLVASLLNAHPDIMIAIEEAILLKIKLFKCSRNQIIHSIIRNSISFSKNRKNVWTGYSYKIENSWQGKFQNLLVIGEKHAGKNSKCLNEDPNAITKLEKIINLKPKIIHVIRNPFDIITTHTRRSFINQSNREPTEMELLTIIKEFFEAADVIKRLKSDNQYVIFDLYHEELLETPKINLSNLIEFLGLRADEDYLDKCCEILYKTPNHSRENVKWSPELISFVEKKLADYAFLKNYKYQE